MKSGWKTTEFWAVVLANVGATTAALTSNLPARWAAIVAAVSTAAYALSRALTKNGAAVAATTVTLTKPAGQ